MKQYLKDEAKHSLFKSQEQGKSNKMFYQIKIVIALWTMGQLPLAVIQNVFYQGTHSLRAN